MKKNEAVYTKDQDKKTLHVVRSFDASLERVWEAWTESELLDMWWAPKPYKAETKTMEFRVGGYWLYSMRGPEGDVHWSKEDFKKIEPQKLINSDTYFCDEEGNIDKSLPGTNWMKDFSGNGDHTTVTVLLHFDSLEDMDKIVAMGFKEGFAAGLDNLEELLSV